MRSGRAVLDLALVRALVGAFATVYLLVRLPYFADLGGLPPSQLAPIGVARLLSSPLPPAATWALALLAVGSGATFTAGRWLRVSAPLFFASFLWVTTYRSSWGKILHSENLVAIHLGILAIGVLLSCDDDEDDARGTLRTLSAVTVATYVVAGVAKLRSGGGAWLSGEALGDWLVFDALRKAELGSFRSPLAAFVASRPAIVQALAIVTLVVELGAPLALVGPRASRAWCAAAWLFHLGILATMAIGFFYPISAVAFASLLVPSMPEWRGGAGGGGGGGGGAPAPFGRLLLPASRG